MHLGHGLDSFFASSAMSTELFERELAPSIEKAMLRSPEVVLSGLLPAVVTAISPNIDLSWSLKKHLLKPLISAVKSSSATVREGCLTSFEAVIARCQNPDTQLEIGQELSKLVKETKAPDTRALYSHMLASLTSRCSAAESLSSDVASLASKEGNEQALDSEAKVVRFQVFSALVAGKKPVEALIKAFRQGLSDKKPATRRIWTLQLGDIVWSLKADELSNSAASSFLDETLEVALKACNDIASNPVAAAQSGSIAPAYVLTAVFLERLRDSGMKSLSQLLKSPILLNAQALDDKVSFLTSHRVYSKITSADEAIWCVRALSAVFRTSKSAANVAWGQAMLFMLTSTTISPRARQEASASIQTLCFADAELLVSTIAESLWHWLRSVRLEEKDTPAAAARTGVERLYQIFRPISTALGKLMSADSSKNGDLVRRQLVRLLVLCRQPLLPRVTWIDMCIRSGVDPSSLVAADPDLCISEARLRAQVSHELHKSRSDRIDLACRTDPI